jgi:hypothetical protein
MKRGRLPSVEMWRRYSCTVVNFFPPAHVFLALCVYNTRISQSTQIYLENGSIIFLRIVDIHLKDYRLL